MMGERHTVIPAAWNALVNAMCQQAPYLRTTLAPDVARFSERLLASDALSAAFTSSLLGYNGSPLEFTVSTAKPGALACTFDPFLPFYTEDRRPAAFARHARHITGAADRADAEPEALAYLQNRSQKPLRFGRWLGRKYTPDGESSKVYTEVHADAFDGCGEEDVGLPFSITACREAGLSLLMVGYYPAQPDGPQEYYFQWHSARITAEDIATVMAFFSCSTLLPAMLSMLEHAVFPATTYGFSLVYGGDGRLESITLFTMAPGFFGSNLRVYPALQALLKETGQTLPLLQGVMDAHIPLQFNVVGFSVNAQGKPALSCTFSPQQRPFDTLTVTPMAPAVRASRPGMHALLSQQSASGAFPSWVRTPDGRWHRDENAFVTAQVLRTLDNTPHTATAIEKALDFLNACEGRPHHFHFWPDNAHPAWMGDERIAADIDDTAIISELLFRFGRISLAEVRQTQVQMNSYRVQNVDPRLKAVQHQWAECQSFYTWMQDENDINQLDCCVNTNALILLHLLKQHDDTPSAYPRIIRMLHQAMQWTCGEYDRLSTLTPYYAHPVEWLAALVYARRQGVEQLSPLISALARWQLPEPRRESPLYRRHDGRFLWTSPCLNQFRSLALAEHTEKPYEYLS